MDKWELEDRFETRILGTLQRRDTWMDDLEALGEEMPEARSPPGYVAAKLKEMEEGKFVPKRKLMDREKAFRRANPAKHVAINAAAQSGKPGPKERSKSPRKDRSRSYRGNDKSSSRTRRDKSGSRGRKDKSRSRGRRDKSRSKGKKDKSSRSRA